MPLAKARRGGSAKHSLARTLWHSLDSLPSSDQIERLISREVARAERNGLHFSLVLFRVKKGGRIGLNERRLALTLFRRIRLTDEVGWFNEEHLCGILPDTSAQGAQIFADAVCELVARKGPRPLAVVYSYPFDWIDHDNDDDNDGPTDPNNGSGGRSTESRGGRHARASGALHSAPRADHPGLGDLLKAELMPPPSGDRRGGPAGYRQSNAMGVAVGREPLIPAHLPEGAVAELEPPNRVQIIAPQLIPAVHLEIKAEVKHLHELLVQPMPWWKRIIDLLGASTAISLFSPLILLSAIAIKLTSKGPIVFKQRRAGLGGQPFTIYKFRTMCNDAEVKKKELRKLSEQDGPAFKMVRDPRITRIGAFLRKTSLDELPQLFNVLKGDMSLVGPRPLPLDEQNAAETWQQRRLDVTPGLTCIWQIEGRSRVTFAEWVRMDVSYMRRQIGRASCRERVCYAV